MRLLPYWRWSTYAGVNLEAGARKGFAPYVSLGGGVMRWDDGELQGMWALRSGISYVGFGRFRPRIAFGYERYLCYGLTLGLGISF